MPLALKIPHAIACLGLSAVLVTLCHVEASAQSVQPGAPVAQSTPGPTASASPNPAPSAANPVPAPGAAGNPNGSPVVAPSTQPARSNASAAPVPTLPILDIVPIASFYQTESDPRAAFQQPQNVDINGTFRIPFGRIFSASFDRTAEGTLNSAGSRVTNAQNKYIYPAPSRDVVLTYRADAQLKRFLIETGFSFRHRECGPGSGDPNKAGPNKTSTEHHYVYLGASYTTPPLAWLNRGSITFNETGQPARHNPAALAGPVSPLDTGKKIWYTDNHFVFILIPINRKYGLTAGLRDTWGALNWYENAPFPYTYAAKYEGTMTKKVNDFLSLTARYTDQRTNRQGAPYVYPNVVHIADLSVLADFHLDFNSFRSR